MIIALYILVVILAFVVYKVFFFIQRQISALYNEKKWIYQIDVFIMPDVENVGDYIKKETKDKNKVVFYKNLWGRKKHECWDKGEHGFVADDRLRNYRYGFDRHIYMPSDSLDKKIIMPVRISQLQDRKGNLISSIDNVNKDPWFQERAGICFNYYQFEFKHDDNIITFLPFYLDCFDEIVMKITEGDSALFSEKLFEFPLQAIIEEMTFNHRKNCWRKKENNEADFFLEKDGSREYRLNSYLKKKIDEGGFIATEDNDCFGSSFQHKYGHITIVVKPIEIN